MRAEFKRYIANDVSGAWAQCLPSSGQLPAGKTKTNIHLATLKLLKSEILIVQMSASKSQT